MRDLWQVSIAAVVVALLAAPLIPVADLLDHTTRRRAPAGATVSGFQLTTVNPFIRLRRDLVEQTHTPLVYAETDARDRPATSAPPCSTSSPTTSGGPRPASSPASNRADGDFPTPPGLAAGVDRRTEDWKFEFAPNFGTTWLPLPYPVAQARRRGQLALRRTHPRRRLRRRWRRRRS